MKRYVIKIGEGYAKWIHWTAGVTPNVVLEGFDKALIVDESYLDYPVRQTGKSRKDLIKEKYPEAEFLEVVVSLVNKQV